MHTRTTGTRPPASPAAQSPAPDPCGFALEQALLALRDDSAVRWLQNYYDPTGNYAGNSFLAVAPNDPWEIDASDLFAISLMNVQVWPRAARKLLEPSGERYAISEALEKIPVDADLATADQQVWKAAEHLYRNLKPLLGQNAWVTASKLCARKRPRFFPVRDRLVTIKRLKLGRDPLMDWRVYRHLITDPEVQQLLAGLTAQASQSESQSLQILDPPLKVLDAVLWMASPK